MASSPRLDHRAPTELRPLSLSLGELDRTDGSGRFSFGSESALASFSGPLEVRLREELPDRATFEVVHRPLEGVGATPSRALVTTLSAVFPPLLGLGQHPRALVQLIVQALSPSPAASQSQSYLSISTSSSTQKTWPASIDADDDMVDRPRRDEGPAPMSGVYFSARAAALNASTLAILDAGSIALRAMSVAVALAYLPNGRAGTGSTNGGGNGGGKGVLVLDPTAEEERRATSRHVFGWAYGAGIYQAGERTDGGDIEDDEKLEGRGEAELVWAESEGDFTRNEFEEAMGQSKLAAARILDFVRRKMEEHFSQRLRQ